MTLPNFLIIGAAKAGTTALHTYLQQHPQIYMTPSKETNFFAFEGEKLNFQGSGDDGINKFSITELSQYEAEFAGVTTETALGEACPLYLYSEKARDNIYRQIPDTRLIVILRNPIDRLYANFLHLIRDDREPFTDLTQAMAAEPERIAQNWEWFWHYTQVGYYGAQLQGYYKNFDAQQIRVYLYDDFRKNPVALMQDICQFVGVDENFVPDMSVRPNKSGQPKNKLLHQLLTKPNPLKTALKPLFPASLRQKIQHQNLTSPAMSAEVRQYLAALYKEDIQVCQELIGRDLSHWLASTKQPSLV